MQNIKTSTKTYFVNFVSYGNSVLNCTKETIIKLFPDNGYCELKFYDKDGDIYESALEIRIDKATLLCYFDEASKCDICYVFFDNIDEVNTYIDLCNQFFDYFPVAKRWNLYSNFLMYLELEDDRYFGFFAAR